MLKKIKGDRHQNRARSPTATRFQATSRRPRARAGGTRGAGCRSPGPRATGPGRGAEPHARADGSGRAALRSRSCSEPQAHAGRGERPPKPGTAGLAAFAAPRPLGVPLPGAPPAPRLPGPCTPGSRGGGAAVTHLGAGGREPGGVAPPGKAPAAAAAQLPNSRSCACGSTIAETPSFPSFKPPANGGAGPREPACSRLPRGPPGRPRTRMRTRTCPGTRRPPRGSV